MTSSGGAVLAMPKAFRMDSVQVFVFCFMRRQEGKLCWNNIKIVHLEFWIRYLTYHFFIYNICVSYLLNFHYWDRGWSDKDPLFSILASVLNCIPLILLSSVSFIKTFLSSSHIEDTGFLSLKISWTVREKKPVIVMEWRMWCTGRGGSGVRKTQTVS